VLPRDQLDEDEDLTQGSVRAPASQDIPNLRGEFGVLTWRRLAVKLVLMRIRKKTPPRSLDEVTCDP